MLIGIPADQQRNETRQPKDCAAEMSAYLDTVAKQRCKRLFRKSLATLPHVFAHML
jgi:RNA polymerase sigma-70 factor (ECF subfamily)